MSVSESYEEVLKQRDALKAERDSLANQLADARQWLALAVGLRSVQVPLGTSVDDALRMLVVRTLEDLKGNKTVAAEVLGISRRCIYNWIERWGLQAVMPSSGDRR